VQLQIAGVMLFHIYPIILLLYTVFGIISICYYTINARRSVKYNYRSKSINTTDTYKDVTIVVPVYNENPKTFERCIKSIANQKSNMIVIGDSSYEPYKSITESYGGTFIYKQVREGKRKGLSTAINYVNTKYVLFVDSDTVIPRNTVKSLISKFGPSIGGVGVGVSIRLKNNWISYSAEFFEKMKEVMFRAMAYSGSVMVLDGRCAMYRTDLIKDFLNSEEYRENVIFGIKSNLAEDRHITSHVAKLGYKQIIDYDVYVKTESQKNFKQFWKQMIRWARAGYLYFFKEFSERAYSKRGLFYTFEMMYLYILPIFVLVLGLMRLDFYLVHGLGFVFRDTGMFYSFITANFARMGFGRFIYTLTSILDAFAVFILAVAVYLRLSKNKRKKKTLVLGGVALLMMFFASFYGLFTLWKQRSWLTR